MQVKLDKFTVELDANGVSHSLSKLVGDLYENYGYRDDELKNLWDIVEKLDAAAFMSLHRNVYFADLLRSVSIYANEDNKVSISNELEKSDENLVIIPSLATPLEKVLLPDRFLKLINRLRNASLNSDVFTVGNNLKDIVDLSIEDIAALNGVGKSYIETFKELQALVIEQNTEFKGFSNDEITKSIDVLNIDTSKYQISMSGVELRFEKPLSKYARHFKLENITRCVETVLGFQRDNLMAIPGFGRTVVDALIEFKDIVYAEVSAIENGDVDYLALESKIIVPSNIESLNIEKVDEVLLDDIDTYLEKLSEDEVDIAQCRWGFVEDKETLEEIGHRYVVTRERIRQKEAGINKGLLLNLRINSNVLWNFLKPMMTPSLKEKLPSLFSCFSSEKAFYEFLDIVCVQEKLFEYVYPEVEKSLLNTYFAESGAPIHIQEAIGFINEEYSNAFASASNAVLSLMRQGSIVIEGEYLWPKMLGKSEASACVLVNHPRGLPWSDIAKLVNANGYSKTDIYEDRLDPKSLQSKDYIYLAGKGVYKHTSFINSEFIDLESVFLELASYIEATGREVFHLNECYQLSDYLKQFNYYEIRHFVKNFGEDHGFYFEGRSQTDSIGLEKGFKNITQKNVILEALNARDKPFTKPEIAGLLKSKSLAHAGVYLDSLMKDAKVVQVDRQLYTTPEQAYHRINLSDYLEAMENVLKELAKPVESSVFQNKLNALFSVSFSKFFYASIARCYGTERGWHRAHGLYSIDSIPFNNISDVLNRYCVMEDSVKDNIQRLQKHIAITGDNAARAVHNWRNSNV